MRKKITLQIKEQPFDEKDSISVVEFATEPKRVYDSSIIYNDTEFRLCREFMNV